jgi:hypothetical protein
VLDGGTRLPRALLIDCELWQGGGRRAGAIDALGRGPRLAAIERPCERDLIGLEAAESRVLPDGMQRARVRIQCELGRFDCSSDEDVRRREWR